MGAVIVTTPPSEAGVWGPCPGSRTLYATAPALPVTQSAREGTAAHFAVKLMVQRFLKTGEVPHVDQYVNRQDHDGTTITREMYLAALDLFNDLMDVLDEHGDPHQIFAEQHLAMPRVHPSMGGPSDLYVWFPAKRRLVIWEFKYGHRPVKAVGNLQLTLYAEGVLTSLGIDGFADQRCQLEFRVVQPRSYQAGGNGVKVWSCAASDIRATINWLATSAQAAHGPDPVLRSGPHCIDCARRHVCPKAAEAAFSAFSLAGDSVPDVLTDKALAVEATLLDLAEKAIKARKSAIDIEVESRVLGGKFIPGFAVEITCGRRRWAVTTSDVKDLGAALGVVLVEEQPVSPAEAERVLKAKGVPEFKAVIAAYTETPSGGPKVVADDGTKAKQVFGAK